MVNNYYSFDLYNWCVKLNFHMDETKHNLYGR